MPIFTLMQDTATGQGYHLAELLKHYHSFRDTFLEWTAALDQSQGQKVGVYQRSLIAWYEARIRSRHPYVGDIWLYLQTAALRYFEGAVDPTATDQLLAAVAPVQDPKDFLPAGVQLNDEQITMHRLLKELGSNCRELLLLGYYHRIGDGRLAEILELSGRQDAAERRRKCLLMVREGWTSAGLYQGGTPASPDQLALIDAYLRDELEVSAQWEVDALRASEPAVRDAIQRREDWSGALQLLGRQDLMEVLQREEAHYRAKPKSKTSIKMPQPSLRLPGLTVNLQNLVIGGLALALAAVAYLTFFDAPQNQRLYNRYYEPAPALTRLSTADPIERELAEMLEPYARGRYREAYEELLPAAPAYPAAPLYLGVCALELEDPNRALDWFGQMQPGDPYYEVADWYRALAYLLSGRRGAAETVVLDIARTEGHPYREKAERLLDDLD